MGEVSDDFREKRTSEEEAFTQGLEEAQKALPELTEARKQMAKEVDPEFCEAQNVLDGWERCEPPLFTCEPPIALPEVLKVIKLGMEDLGEDIEPEDIEDELQQCLVNAREAFLDGDLAELAQEKQELDIDISETQQRVSTKLEKKSELAQKEIILFWWAKKNEKTQPISKISISIILESIFRKLVHIRSLQTLLKITIPSF